MAQKRFVILSFLVRAVVCILIIGSSLGIFMALLSTRPRPGITDRGNELPNVLVLRAAPVNVVRVWEGYGTARAMDVVDVPAEVGAIVEAIPEGIEAGYAVNADALLATLDRADFDRRVEIRTQNIADIDAQLEQIERERESWTERTRLAREFAELARAEMQRVQDAMGRGAAKPRELDQARQALIAATRDQVIAEEEFDKLVPRRTSLTARRAAEVASKRLDERNIERCTITAPIAGVLQHVDMEVGENLTVGHAVARIVNLSRIEVPLMLPSSARSTIAVGDTARLFATGSDDQSWTGKVSRIAPEDDQSMRTVAVFVEIEQQPSTTGTLAPGKFVRGLVESSTSDERTVVPRRAVVDGHVLMVVDDYLVARSVQVDDHIEASYPELGVPTREWAVLRGDLGDGALIVVSPGPSTPSGLQVRPVVAELAGGSDSGTSP